MALYGDSGGVIWYVFQVFAFYASRRGGGETPGVRLPARCTVVLEIPSASAIVRTLQFVVALGLSCSARWITCFTLSASYVRGRPDRGVSCRPSRPGSETGCATCRPQATILLFVGLPPDSTSHLRRPARCGPAGPARAAETWTETGLLLLAIRLGLNQRHNRATSEHDTSGFDGCHLIS